MICHFETWAVHNDARVITTGVATTARRLSDIFHMRVMSVPLAGTTAVSLAVVAFVGSNKTTALTGDIHSTIIAACDMQMWHESESSF